MTNKPIPPKPTSYQGQMFRSKSEAKMAFVLDAWVGDCDHLRQWQYEPDDIIPNTRHCEWLPDFSVRFRGNGDDPWMQILIEYKPTRPTAAYIDWWKQQSAGIDAHGISKTRVHRPLGYAIISYDFYEQSSIPHAFIKPSRFYDTQCDSGRNVVLFAMYNWWDVLRSHDFASANDYRFDLDYRCRLSRLIDDAPERP